MEIKDYKIAWITEGLFEGKVIPDIHCMRNDLTWMHIFNADHIPISKFHTAVGYDIIIITWPKGETFLNAVGCEIGENNINRFSELLSIDVIGMLKQNNSKICFMQEGPVWFSNDYSIIDQFNFYNKIIESDIILCHNECDTKWYRGLFPEKDVRVLPIAMIDELIQDIKWKPEDKAIIGGNFAKWYGGFQSYIVAQEFGVENWIPSMHAKRENEDEIPNLNHLPYLNWLEWIRTLSTFKYAVHLMPTIAAGTFSLNCAYFGIPCIGNEKIDPQRLCHPDLSVDVEDIANARKLAQKLKNDEDFYNHCSNSAKFNYTEHFHISKFKEKFNWTNN